MGTHPSHLPANNKKQSMLPEGCAVFPNRNGTAPGICIEKDGKTLLLFPGPPGEMEPMFLEYAVPFLRGKSGWTLVSRNLKVAGVGESRAEEMLSDIIHKYQNPTVAPYAKPSEVWMRVTASAESEDEARRLIEPAAAEIYAVLGDNIYGEDGDSLESVALDKLKARGMTLACAESCTGGMLTAKLVNHPGVSEVLREGIIAYANESKLNRLAIDNDLLQRHGAVSRQTAAAMAEGAAKCSGAQVGLSTTGVAGPGGGTPDKPVGLVYIGLYIEGRETSVIQLNLTGNREKIRTRTTFAALDHLRRNIL
jgi:nicotinamide-nucleotide amidase